MDALRGNLLRHWRRVAAHVGSLCSVVIVLLPEKTAKRHEGSEALLIFRSRRGAAQPSSLTQVTLVCCVPLVGKPFWRAGLEIDSQNGRTAGKLEGLSPKGGGA
ncbi:hypothetical protein GCM10009733_033660 [Nonomuraea maheshkhaliensis]|uniref:Uncharacterized protein n=1 Tax=Nonomuraea maheshkhaliensis TaxID=419590 RepID=A0ABN2F8U3_9ACTN